jgi:hypothetical protein
VGAEESGATNLLDLLGAPGRCSGCWPHDGEVAGRCMFNRETQIDHCEKKINNPDGSIMVGTTENRYSFDRDKTLKMIVAPKMITDTPFSDAPFDIFPVHCPEGTIWSILNESGSPR